MNYDGENTYPSIFITFYVKITLARNCKLRDATDYAGTYLLQKF